MSTLYQFTGGVDASVGFGQKDFITFAGTWLVGEHWKLTLVTTQGDYVIGYDRINALASTVCMTFKNRVYVGAGPQFNFSDNSDATGWEVQNPGSGFITLLANFSQQDVVKGLGSMQGRLVVLGRKHIQIWQTDADPANFDNLQVLENIGTLAPLSVHPLGQLDLVFLYDTGIRSLRTRTQDLNASPEDIGIAIDALVQAKLDSCSADEKAAACGVVEPRTGLYWLFLKDTIYVLSYFPMSKITAWSKFDPTYQATSLYRLTNNSGVSRNFWLGFGPATGATAESATQGPFTLAAGASQDLIAPAEWVAMGTSVIATATDITDGAAFSGLIAWSGSAFAFTNNQQSFVPKKFLSYNGLVYCRGTVGSTDYLFTYGGSAGTTYDNCSVVAETPWLDDTTPLQIKTQEDGMAKFKGAWLLYVGDNPPSDTYTLFHSGGSTTAPSSESDSPTDKGTLPIPLSGTHFRFKAISDPRASTVAVLSNLMLSYTKGTKNL